MGAVMTGNGIAGIGTTALRAITLAALPEDDAHPNNEYYGALIFFFIGAFFMILCVITQLWLKNN